MLVSLLVRPERRGFQYGYIDKEYDNNKMKQKRAARTRQPVDGSYGTDVLEQENCRGKLGMGDHVN